VVQPRLGGLVAGLTLPDELARRLDAASPVSLGFPHDFMNATREFVFGAADERFDPASR
jgi:hypothetical protein